MEYFNSCVSEVYQKGWVGIPIEEYKDYRVRKLVMARPFFILEGIGKTVDCVPEQYADEAIHGTRSLHCWQGWESVS
jgi:hypothetical protein